MLQLHGSRPCETVIGRWFPIDRIGCIMTIERTFDAMPATQTGLTWIASYPKSGNTWIRFMACNLLFGRQRSASTLNSLAPDLHEVGRSILQAPVPALLKTHFRLSPQLPLLNHTVAAIYVVRHPMDVAMSNFFYAQRRDPTSGTSTAALDRYIDTFIECRGDPRWIQIGLGSWEENVRSWFDTPTKFAVLRLHYEDVVRSPAAACRAIASLLNQDRSEAELSQVVSDCSFERMREIERSDIAERRVGIFYKPYLQASIDAGHRFMRQGSVGDGARCLNAKQRARMQRAFEPLLTTLGYCAETAGTAT